MAIVDPVPAGKFEDPVDLAAECMAIDVEDEVRHLCRAPAGAELEAAIEEEVATAMPLLEQSFGNRQGDVRRAGFRRPESDQPHPLPLEGLGQDAGQLQVDVVAVDRVGLCARRGQERQGDEDSQSRSLHDLPEHFPLGPDAVTVPRIDAGRSSRFRPRPSRPASPGACDRRPSRRSARPRRGRRSWPAAAR